MEHVISVLVENKFGVLATIAGLFSGRGFNIDSLAVGETSDPSISRMTVVVKGDDRVVEQILKQLNRLVEVITAEDLSDTAHVERELVLIKVAVTQDTRSEIIEIVDIFRAKIVDVQKETLTVEVSGSSGKVDALMGLLSEYGIKEVVRTGRVAMSRG